MNNVTHKLAIFGLALAMISLAATLALAFTELLSHVDLGSLGADATETARAETQPGYTQATLLNALGVFEMLAHWIVSLAVVLGLLVLPVGALILFGMGGVCLHCSLAGLLKRIIEPEARTVALHGDDRQPDATLSLWVLSQLRKRYPSLFSAIEA